MVKIEHANQILQNEGLLYQLTETIIKEITNDDEPFDSVARHLLLIYLENPEIVDEIMIALCGWNMKSLMEKI